MVSVGAYATSVALLAALVLSLGFAAVQLRRRLLPVWEGPPARLVEAIVAIALLIWLAELLGLFGLLYAWTLVPAAVLLAAAVACGPRVLSGGRGAGPSLGSSPAEEAAVRDRERGEEQDAAPSRHPSPPPPAGGAGAAGAGGWLGRFFALGVRGAKATGVEGWVPRLLALGAVAVVFAHWGLTAADAASRGIFNFDSLWYHMPFAVEMAQSHSVTGLHYTETVFTNWFYPQNSELLHAVGILLTERDTLSLFLNFGWLAIAFLAAWCIGRPYGVAPLTVVAAAILLDSRTLVVRESGAAKNDVMAAALLLAAIAVLINVRALHPRVAWGGGAGTARRPVFRPGGALRRPPTPQAKNPATARHPLPTTGPAAEGLPLAIAGLAVGLAVGTKVTVLAMVAALSVAVVVLAPAGRRVAAAGWWFLPALAGGGFWYLRNLVVADNPLPQVESLGPFSLPHPESLQSGRPDFSVAHYASDTAVWADYFAPGLEHAFGLLWPLVVGGAVFGGVLALLPGRDRLLRWLGAVALFGLLAYAFTPLSAAGPEGAPEAFRINLRFAVPALLAGLTLLPVAIGRWSFSRFPSAGGVGRGCRDGAASRFSPLRRSRTAANSPGEKPSDDPAPPPRDRTRGCGLTSLALIALLLVFAATDRVDAVLRDPDRLFAWALAALLVLVPAALLWTRGRGASRRGVAAGFAALALAVAALGYPLQRDYLADRFRNADPERAIPGMGLDAAYRWARGVEDARIGLAGTTAGFLQYGFYGTDLSNRVRYLGERGPRGAFNAIPTCRAFRAAVNAADPDYVVTAPFLNFIEPERPIPSPEAGWLRGAPAATPIVPAGRATVWRLDGRLDPFACGPANAPRRRVPQQPAQGPSR